MFVTFDETEYPIVKVNFTGVVRNDSDFSQFTDKWLELYERNTNFTLINSGVISSDESNGGQAISIKLTTSIPFL